LGGASCAPGAARRRGPLADGPSRGAQPVGVAPARCGDHQPAFQRGRGRWLTKRHSSLLSRACSTEGSCGSPSSRDRRRHHVLGRPRRRGAAPRRIVRRLDRRLTRYRERRAAPSLLHFRQVHPARTPIFGRLEAQDGARDRPGVDSPRRCGVSARPWRVQGCA
ncbi:hypothetical protein EMIHUDRAFT_457816, partial [Emiliania huxleyi CCMP1516]|uniref:Uncharacterized protein n=2 Tax=Emiliania huxleyi TaxID=2903 RepID=A0A0D3JL63_EMIH1